MDDLVMDDNLTLRAFREDDLGFLDRLCTDPEALGPFEWAGFGDVRARRRRWEQDGYIGTDSAALAVVLADGTVAGIASWKAKSYGSPGACYEIGLALLPEHRGHGLGTAAQRLLVDYLFKYTTAHRLEALTDTENIAERKALERIGFKREGVMRGVFFQRGTWRDQAIYALLRDDQRGGP
jgi:RimJ/RimL family protein N-acetyltransferase